MDFIPLSYNGLQLAVDNRIPISPTFLDQNALNSFYLNGINEVGVKPIKIARNLLPEHLAA